MKGNGRKGKKKEKEKEKEKEKKKEQEETKRKEVQRGTSEMDPKVVFLHKNCQEKSQRN